MHKSHCTTRRDFLKVAGAAVAAPYVIPSSALGNAARPPASERIVVAGIGIGNQGSSDQDAFLNRDDVQYVAACDVRADFRNTAKGRADNHYKNKDCKVYNDFRELLARKDIDVVHVATPDHWHAIMVIEACRAGKDVYCQKPETLTLREGPLMVQAARRYGRVVSGGSQRVLEDYRKIVDPCWDGTLGAIKSINVNVGPTPRLCNLAGQPVPANIDWDLWLGPAPWAPYNERRAAGTFGFMENGGSGWRAWNDYSGGMMTDWGAHHFGGALFAIDVRELQPTEVTYHKENYLTFQFPNGIQLTNNLPGAENLQVVGTPGQKRPPKTVPNYKGEGGPSYSGKGGIHGDFIHCVKTREKPFRDIEFAVNTAVVCQLTLVAYELKRSLKWDAAQQQFPGDDEANRLVDRARREPWQL
jgi:hypothetical protein